jgi:O-antigen/teichoic acid export membrane protein
LLIPAILFRETIVELVYGIQFIPAANTFIIHLLGALQGSIFFWTLPLMNSLGLTGLRFRIYLFATIAGLVVAWATAATAGAAGVASALLTANLIITGLFLWFTFNFIRRNENNSAENLVLN